MNNKNIFLTLLLANLACGAASADLPQPPLDVDADGYVDYLDNCIDVANDGQEDADFDGIGNHCDADFNNDCTVNVVDLGIFRQRFFSDDSVADLNADGQVNVGDLGLLRLLFLQTPGPSGRPNACTRPATGILYAGSRQVLFDTEYRNLFLVEVDAPFASTQITADRSDSNSDNLKLFRNGLQFLYFAVHPDSGSVFYGTDYATDLSCEKLYASPLDGSQSFTQMSLPSNPCLIGKPLLLDAQGTSVYVLSISEDFSEQQYVSIDTTMPGTSLFESPFSTDRFASLARLSEDGKWLHFSRRFGLSDSFHAYVSNVAISDVETQVTFGTGSSVNVEPIMLPDSSAAIFLNNNAAPEPANALLIDYSNLNSATQLNPTGGDYESVLRAAISPDGLTVYYSRVVSDNGGFRYAIFKVDLATPGVESLLFDTGASPIADIALSPDGKTLAVSNNQNSAADLFLVNVADPALTVTVDRGLYGRDQSRDPDQAIDNSAQFDPTGRYLYFAGRGLNGDASGFFRVATLGDGRSVRMSGDHPTLSPADLMSVSRDGRFLAYAVQSDLQSRELFIVPTATPGIVQKMNGPAELQTPVDDFEFIY